MTSEHCLSLTGQFEDVGSILHVLSTVLTQLIETNHKSNQRQHFVTKFQSSYAPNITIQAYLERIDKYAKCSPNCFIIAFIYIDRLMQMRNIVLTSLNVHRILITSILLSTKVFDDEFYKNAYYAKLGGVSTAEMNTLEVEFLSLVNFNLSVSTETYDKYQKDLKSSYIAAHPTFALPSLVQDTQVKNSFRVEAGPQITVPEYNEKIHDADPNTISPLRPLDAHSIATTGCIVNHNVHLTSIMTPQSGAHSSASLFHREDTFAQGAPQKNPWPSMPNNLPKFSTASHESPRSLVSYPSGDPSPTFSSADFSSHQTEIYMRQERSHPESHAFVPSSSGCHGHAIGDVECIFAQPMAPPSAHSFPSNPYSAPFSLGIDPNNLVVQTQQQQKYPRQRVSHPNPASAAQSQHNRMFSYHNRPHSIENTNTLQHYEVSGVGHPQQAPPPYAYSYRCASYANQPTQPPYCPVPIKNYGGNQMQFSGITYPPQQLPYMGGYYYQPVPSHLASGQRYLVPSTTPNSVAEIFGPSKNDVPGQVQSLQTEDYLRSNPQPLGRCNSGYGSNPYPLGYGIQQPYYAWPDQHGASCHGVAPHFQYHGLSTDANSYPATTLFYPVPLRTVS